MILATFGNVVVIPMSVSFFTEEVHYSPAWIALNVAVDFLFIMDLCLNFRIGFWSDENGVSDHIHLLVFCDQIKVMQLISEVTI